MEQGKYKTLFLKLSGTALGLVGMLTVAAVLGQGFIADETSNSVFVSNKKPEPEDVSIQNAINKELKVVSETGVWAANEAIKEARVAIEAVRSEQYERLMDVQSTQVAALGEAIAEISSQITIPESIKEDIIIDLEQQLEKTEKKLGLLEEKALEFSYKMILPKSTVVSKSCDKDQEIIFEECEDGQCTHDEIDQKSKGESKGTIEAFYWI